MEIKSIVKSRAMSKTYQQKARICERMRVKLPLRYPNRTKANNKCVTKQEGEIIMSAKNNNKLNIPEAKAAMNKFKMEAAAEMGINLKDGYNGDLTSREAGSVGGQMVKKMIQAYENGLK